MGYASSTALPVRSSTALTMAYWVTTALTAALFAVPGVLLLVHTPHFASEMAHLGYPAYFMSILGPWKILGAAVVLLPGVPRLKEWAYAGMIFDATSAAVSRGVLGDGALAVLGPLLITCLVLASWALRPDERKLR